MGDKSIGLTRVACCGNTSTSFSSSSLIRASRIGVELRRNSSARAARDNTVPYAVACASGLATVSTAALRRMHLEFVRTPYRRPPLLDDHLRRKKLNLHGDAAW